MLTQVESASLLAVSVALGVGLLTGAERERRRGTGPERSAAGIRTFAFASLIGVVAMLAGGGVLMAVATMVVGGFALLTDHRSRTTARGTTTRG